MIITIGWHLIVLSKQVHDFPSNATFSYLWLLKLFLYYLIIGVMKEDQSSIHTKDTIHATPPAPSPPILTSTHNASQTLTTPWFGIYTYGTHACPTTCPLKLFWLIAPPLVIAHWRRALLALALLSAHAPTSLSTCIGLEVGIHHGPWWAPI